MYYIGQGVGRDYVQAYKWVSLSVSRSSGETRDQAVWTRDIVAAKMTPEQIAEALKLTREWKPQ